jgi:hypothetical protein
MRTRVWAAFLLGLLLLGLVGSVQGEGKKQVFVVFTTDTNGELNPCG